MNIPIFKISGAERRDKKKTLSQLKAFFPSFWYHHQLDKDMCLIYGSDPSFLMSDEKAKTLYDKKSNY